MSQSLFGNLAKKAATLEQHLKNFDTKVQKLGDDTVKYTDKLDRVSRIIEKKISKKPQKDKN